MKEDDSNWFSKWEEQLPSPEDLMPITQTLITPDLALAFDIRTHHPHHQQQHPPPLVSSQPNSGEFDSPELTAGGGGGGSGAAGDEPARTLKRPRLVWTPQLHKRFVDAVAHLGIKNAVPKTIMQLMSVDGLTRENVASHLQKYRLYLKRMQGLSSGGGGGGVSAGDAATDHLFASSPVPPHFLHQGRPPNSDQQHYLPYVPVAALQQHHHQMAAAVAGHHPQLQPRYGHLRNGQFEHPFLNRQTQSQSQQQQSIHRVGTPIHNSLPSGRLLNTYPDKRLPSHFTLREAYRKDQESYLNKSKGNGESYPRSPRQRSQATRTISDVEEVADDRVMAARDLKADFCDIRQFLTFREIEKPVPNWSDKDKRLVNIDTKARSLISMSLLDDVLHSTCHLKTFVLMESRKIFLVCQFENFIHIKGETLSQTHQRFNCLLIDLKTISTKYSNSEVITKFMESLPEHWKMYTTCLTMSKAIKTNKLKKNLLRDTKDFKSTSLALVTESVPSVPTSSVTITELDPSDSAVMSDSDSEFNDSLALLTNSFKRFARKSNFQKRKPLYITNKPKSTPVDKATFICFKCKRKGHFATECRYKNNQFAPSTSTSSSKNPKYQRLKEKYKKTKSR
ncbi:hypothetical protein OSB04_023833 [Centaurea solstitialis]|uniref:Uncharacterized protein n=1 Tax=Centaurea solstitialis TaxID=347529 RepID=A0AA38SYD3_9ASTR|nr:hypothetical protein OSB04_023833 [Centaurea solstitialis]